MCAGLYSLRHLGRWCRRPTRGRRADPPPCTPLYLPRAVALFCLSSFFIRAGCFFFSVVRPQTLFFFSTCLTPVTACQHLHFLHQRKSRFSETPRGHGRTYGIIATLSWAMSCTRTATGSWPRRSLRLPLQTPRSSGCNSRLPWWRGGRDGTGRCVLAGRGMSVGAGKKRSGRQTPRHRQWGLPADAFGYLPSCVVTPVKVALRAPRSRAAECQRVEI